MADNDIAIIGGGISGLSLAFYCARAGLSVTVLEKDTRVGGAFHSYRVPESGDGFWVELGAHTCYNTYGNLLEIAAASHLLPGMLPRQKAPFTVLVDNQIKSIVSQLNLMEMAFSLPSLFFQDKAGKSVAAYYSRIVGRRNFDKVFRHLFNAVIAQEADDFPAEILFKKRPRRKDVLRSFTFKGGVQTIAEKIAATPGLRVVTGREVRHIERINGRYNVATDDGGLIKARYLAIATPAPVAAGLLHEVHPEISRYVSQVRLANVNSVGVVLRRQDVSIKPVAGIIAANDLFYSAVSRDVVPDEQFRGFTFHFRPEVTDQNVRTRRIADVLGIQPGQIEHLISKVNAIPALRVGHQALVERIDAVLRDSQLLLVGNYFGGVAIEDCVTRSLKEFTRLARVPQQTA